MEKATEKDMAVIPYFAHEGMMVRLERANTRLIIALIIAVVLMFASNGAWLYSWMQYDYVEGCTDIITTLDREGDGIANYTGNNGGVYYGEGYSPQMDADANADANPD